MSSKIPQRKWVNQPSTLQPYHALHGTNVLAVHERDGTDRIYFLSGDVISQEIDPMALSEGWRPERKTPTGNPNHPVSQSVEGQWHKIAAMLVSRTGKRRLVITLAEVEKLANAPEGINITVRFDDSQGIVLTLVTDAEAERLAKEEGGLPA
jgi:hypothetical protein